MSLWSNIKLILMDSGGLLRVLRSPLVWSLTMSWTVSDMGVKGQIRGGFFNQNGYKRDKGPTSCSSAVLPTPLFEPKNRLQVHVSSACHDKTFDIRGADHDGFWVNDVDHGSLVNEI